jgi:predicted GH43/DUF377 family glycosyl hydrolase
MAVAIDTGPQRFDCLHVFDPAAVVADGQVFLCYSAVGPYSDMLGMARSRDGVAFRKSETPILAGRAPELVWSDGRFYLFYVLKAPDQGYVVHLATSGDGEAFTPLERPILTAGKPGAWDGFEVTTPRLFERSGVYYMLYAGEGDPSRKDKPGAFGLARSGDLVSWERDPRNPVFLKGAPGAWDDGAIWFGTVFSWGDALYLLYEGGAARDLSREGPALTQVGLARVHVQTFDQWVADW